MPIQSTGNEILIVGGGPCGLMLSIELSLRGIPTILVDAKPATATNPQANATQARTMEYYRRLGFADDIRSMGLPKDYPTDISYFTRYSKQELARFKLPSSGNAKNAIHKMGTSWSAAELPHRVSQKFVEQVLRKHAEASDLSSVNYGWRLNTFRQIDDQVEAHIENVESGEVQIITAPYLIGVDGAKSTVREQLGIVYGGETGVKRDFFGGTMVSLYIRAPEFYNIVKEKAWMYWAFNNERRSWLAAVDGQGEFAFHTQLKPGEDTNISDERAHELLSQVMGMPLNFEILSRGTWLAGHALVAERFVDGRVILGGDAAHLFTPAGGLGYNTAVEDAVNLAWKLAAILKGVGGSALLQSYEYERHMLATRNTQYARSLADSIGNFLPDPTLEDDTQEGQQARAMAGEYLNAHARREFNIPGITFGGRYDGSPIIVDDGTNPPEDKMNQYIQSATPGGRTPHFWLADGRSLYDVIGLEWCLLSMGAAQNLLDEFVETAKQRGMELKVLEIDSAEAKELYETDCVLIRPDQIVAWRHQGSHNCQAILDQVLGLSISNTNKGTLLETQ